MNPLKFKIAPIYIFALQIWLILENGSNSNTPKPSHPSLVLALSILHNFVIAHLYLQTDDVPLVTKYVPLTDITSPVVSVCGLKTDKSD